MEGYVYNSYGKIDYLKHTLASVYSLRRFDKVRPVALFCDDKHRDFLNKYRLSGWFDIINLIDPSHCSIVGFKHNVDKYMIYDANLFLDSDIIWCKNPEKLWKLLSTYSFTITGTLKADLFFGSHKDFRIISDIILNRRKKTLNFFGLTYLSRVQSGMIYAQDYNTTKSVCQLADSYMQGKHGTHFRERLLPDGSTEESDEWGFAMAMSRLNLPIIQWHQGTLSPQLDFVSSYVKYDPNFNQVQYMYYTNQLMNNLRGIRSKKLRDALKLLFQIIPSMRDYLWVTPFSLHFSWKHEKKPFEDYAEKIWSRIVANATSSK